MSELTYATPNMAGLGEGLAETSAEYLQQQAEGRFDRIKDSLAAVATRSTEVIVGFASKLDPRKSKTARLLTAAGLGFGVTTGVANAETYETHSPLNSPVGALTSPEQVDLAAPVITSGLNTLNIKLSTSKPTLETISIGVGDFKNALVIEDGTKPKRNHSVTVRGLEPAKLATKLDPTNGYVCNITAKPAVGKAEHWVVPCPTNQITQPVTITSRDKKLFLDEGKGAVPFFSIAAMQLMECPAAADINTLIGMGVNVLDSYQGCNVDAQDTPDYLHSLLHGDVLLSDLLQPPDRVEGLPEAAHWQAKTTNDPTHPNKNLWNPDFCKATDKLATKVSTATVPAIANFTVAAASNFCLTPQILEQNTLTAVAKGAAGIEIMPSLNGSQRKIKVSPEIQVAAGRNADLIASISPAILTGKAAALKTTGKAVAGAWQYEDHETVVLVSTVNYPITATFLGNSLRAYKKLVSIENKGAVSVKFSKKAGTITVKFAARGVLVAHLDK